MKFLYSPLLIFFVTSPFIIQCMDVISCKTIPKVTYYSEVADPYIITKVGADTVEIRRFDNFKLLNTFNDKYFKDFFVLNDKLIINVDQFRFDSNLIKVCKLDGTLLYEFETKCLRCSIVASSSKLFIIGQDTIEIRDMDSGNLLKRVKNDQHDGDRPYFVPAGNKFLTIAKSVKIWDLEGNCLGTIDTHIAWRSVIATTHNKIIVAFDDRDPIVYIYDLNNGDLLQTLRGHTAKVSQIQVYKDKIITRSKDRTIKIWNFDGTCILTLESDHSYDFPFKIAGEHIITALGKDVLIYDLKDGKLLHTIPHDEKINSIEVINGKIFTAPLESGIIKVCDLTTANHLFDLPCKIQVPRLAHFENQLIIYGRRDDFQMWTDLRPSTRKQELMSLAAAMHPRCGKDSPAHTLSSDILKNMNELEKIQPWAPVARPIDFREIIIDP